MIEKIKGRDHLVIKRDGRLQKYSPSKLKRAINWCTEDNEALTKQLFESLNLKLYNKIRIEKLWDEVIETAANLISDMYPIWDGVAKRAYLLKIYKESWNYNESIDSLRYQQVIDKGVQVGVYDKSILETFSEEEISELGRYTDKERDLSFTFIGLVSIMEKYAFNATKTKKLELPQHVYMRLAMYPFWEENKDIRLGLIKQRYDDLSLFRYTEATPKMINSLTDNTQMASCVLMRPDDKSESINETNGNLGLFSKYGGGLACDVSALRSSGSLVGNKGGKSSGPTQFIKIFEATVGAYDQMGCVSRNTWVKRIKDIEKDGIIYTVDTFIEKFGTEEIESWYESDIKYSGKGGTNKSNLNKYKQSKSKIDRTDISPFSPDFYIKQGYTQNESKKLAQKFYKENKYKNTSKNLPNGNLSSENKFIDRYGEDVGKYKYYQSQKTKIKITLEYLMDKYNITKEEASKIKATNSLEKQIELYGEEEGQKRYLDIGERTINKFKGYSEESIKFFEKLLIPYLEKIKNIKIEEYYHAKNGKEMYLLSNGKIKKYDLYIPDLNLIVEYHGVAFHPKRGNLEWVSPFGKTYESVFENDQEKKLLAQSNGYKYMEIFSNELENFKEILEGVIHD